MQAAPPPSGGAGVVHRQPGSPSPTAERAAAMEEAMAVAGRTSEQVEAQSDAEDALKLNRRKRKDKTHAWSLDLKDKARIQKSGTLSPEHQQEITVKIRFSKVKRRRRTYRRSAQPCRSEFAELEQVVEMLWESTGTIEFEL